MKYRQIPVSAPILPIVITSVFVNRLGLQYKIIKKELGVIPEVSDRLKVLYVHA